MFCFGYVAEKAFPFCFLDGYINESGRINTERLQVVLDEMAQWEREVFEKVYSDMNWYKGKQNKHVKEMEKGKQQAALGTYRILFPSTLKDQHFLFFFLHIVFTKNQREIFDKIKTFVLENRKTLSPSHYRAARLALPNEFPARDRVFITKLSEALHLEVGWDEYDDQDQNLVTWRLPRRSHGRDSEDNEEKEGDDEEEEEADKIVEQDGSTPNSEWEDEVSDDDDEALAAVDRVLNKYEKVPIVDLDTQGSFDERYEKSVKEKMDEWKRGYYQV